MRPGPSDWANRPRHGACISVLSMYVFLYILGYLCPMRYNPPNQTLYMLVTKLQTRCRERNISCLLSTAPRSPRLAPFVSDGHSARSLLADATGFFLGSAGSGYQIRIASLTVVLSPCPFIQFFSRILCSNHSPSLFTLCPTDRASFTASTHTSSCRLQPRRILLLFHLQQAADNTPLVRKGASITRHRLHFSSPYLLIFSSSAAASSRIPKRNFLAIAPPGKLSINLPDISLFSVWNATHNASSCQLHSQWPLRPPSPPRRPW